MGAPLSHSERSLRVNAREYHRTVQAAISEAPHVVASDISFDEIDVNECYIHGVLTLVGSCELHLAEYVVTEPDLQRLKYRYHLQRANGAMLARWDNVPHHRDVHTFPDHRHNASGSVHPSPPIDVFQLLTAVVPFITSADNT
jgi:hypothetical protein